MSSPEASDSSPESASAAVGVVDGGTAESKDAAQLIEASEPHNLLWLEIHQVAYRIAWIFKTESVIMPAFVDAIVGPAGGAWARGCLPVLNRIGQSVPPLFYAATLRDLPQKRWALIVSTILMAVPFLALAAIWAVLGPAMPGWVPIFLVLYFVFFATTGINQLASGTVLGKLVQADHRGGLIAVSGTFGTVGASTLAWFLLQYWLSLPDRGWAYIFGFTGLGFIVAGLLALPLIEPNDTPAESHPDWRLRLWDSWTLFRDDRHFRRLLLVAMLFITAQFLFPHYQALGRQFTEKEAAEVTPGGDVLGFQMMLWIVVQNLGVGLFSFIFGHLADWYGNRLVLRIVVFGAALTPLSALLFVSGWLGPPERLYWLTFVLLGLLPVGLRTVQNYTLELCPPTDHPRYVSTLSLSQALPLCLSPLMGIVMDLFGFDLAFYFIAGLIGIAGLLTLDMLEPRSDPTLAHGQKLDSYEPERE